MDSDLTHYLFLHIEPDSDPEFNPGTFVYEPKKRSKRRSKAGGESSPARDPEAVDSEGESVLLPPGDGEWDDPSLEFAEDYDDEEAAAADGDEEAVEAEEV